MEVEEIKGKIYHDPIGFPRQYGPIRTDKKPGRPFLPHELYRDMVIILLLTGFLFILSGVETPPIGESGNPVVQPFIVPDWYLLFSWGYVKVTGFFPTISVADPWGNVVQVMDPPFWGSIISGLPFIFLILVPFLDRGRESRPVKSPWRSSLGILGIIHIFGASLYSINNLVIEKWEFINDDSLKWFMVGPAVLGFLATYIGLRRLAFLKMRNTLILGIGVALAFLSLAVASALVFEPSHLGLSGSQSFFVGLTLLLLLLFCAGIFLPIYLYKEDRARRLVYPWIALFGFVLLFYFYFLGNFLPQESHAVVSVLFGTTHNPAALVPFALTGDPLVLIPWFFSFLVWNILLPVWIVAIPFYVAIAGYVGIRKPYSTYEYLLNECYQCGKCHTVCPVVDVENEAIGGLNLVYNTFKKKHDGVPLWTCLACDACSAVCPLDIMYSDYIREERVKATGGAVAGGVVASGVTTTAVAADGGKLIG